MRYEPPFDQRRLLATIRDAYGIVVSDLRFVPFGLAACYVASSGGNDRYFVKVWPDLRLGQPAAERQNASLKLTRALHDRGLGLRVPYPLLTRGAALWSDLAGMPFAVSLLLSGSAPPEPWPVALGEELARTIATINRATPHVADLMLPCEKLDIQFESALLEDLESAGRIEPEARPGLLDLRRWALARQDAILEQLGRLHESQAVAREVDGKLVLCHTDLHSNNLLVEDGEPLGILDWDDAKIAPPEHDLWAGLGWARPSESFDAFLKAYWRAGGYAPLHLEHFAFYLLRRYIEDLAVCLHRLLRPDAEEREDTMLLRGLDACVARWSRLDETLATVAAALRQEDS